MYATKRYQGYRKYTKNSSNPGKPSEIVDISLPSTTLPSVQEPAMNVDSLYKLAKFLDTSQSTPSFPEITVLPDLFRSIGKFVNERKKMKYAHKEFEKKVEFLSDGLSKQFHVALTKIEKETEVQLAQINGNISQQLKQINRYYDLETQRLLTNYHLKREEMNLYYKNLEAQRKEQARRFDRMLKYATIERKRAQKAIREAGEVSAFLKTKIYANTATVEEREHYMELLRFRVEGVSVVTNIIPQLAAKVQ